jgi:hypothetical protein
MLLMLLLFTNCRKDNLSDPVKFNKTQLVEDFFKVSSTADSEIKALANDLKKQDSLFNFLPKFTAKNGYPVWDKVAFKSEHQEQNLKVFSTQSQAIESNNKGLFLVPLVDATTKRVKSYLVAKKHGKNAYAYQLYNREDLSKTKVNDSLKNNLIQTQALFGYFEKEINGVNEIEITNPKRTKIKDVNLSFETNSKNLKTQSIKTNAVICELRIEVKISYIDFTDGSSLQKTEITISIACYDTGGGGSGSGGTTPTNPPSGGTTPSNPYNPYNPYHGGNWYDYGAGYPNPYAPRYFVDPYDPYNPFIPIFYPWFGGGGGSVPTTAYQLTARDYQILNDIATEDNDADNNNSSYYGTARSGNIKWAGTLEHWIIQFDYVNTVFGSEREYSIPGSSINGNRGYADIVNIVTNEIFEIKPPTQTFAGVAEVNTYVAKANENCSTTNGGQWQKGTNYPTKFFLNPKDPSFAIRASLDEPGLIIYRDVNRSTNPVSYPVALPQNLAIKLKDFLQSLLQNQANMNQKILVFLRENPEVKNWIMGAAAGLIVATLVEDVVTGGVGIADDWASFLIARNMWRVAAAI